MTSFKHSFTIFNATIFIFAQSLTQAAATEFKSQSTEFRSTFAVTEIEQSLKQEQTQTEAQVTKLTQARKKHDPVGIMLTPEQLEARRQERRADFDAEEYLNDYIRPFTFVDPEHPYSLVNIDLFDPYNEELLLALLGDILTPIEPPPYIEELEDDYNPYADLIEQIEDPEIIEVEDEQTLLALTEPQLPPGPKQSPDEITLGKLLMSSGNLRTLNSGQFKADDIQYELPKYFKGYDEGYILIENNRPKQPVKVTIKGDGAVLSQGKKQQIFESAFDEEGEIEIHIVSTAPYQQPVQICIESNDKQLVYVIPFNQVEAVKA